MRELLEHIGDETFIKKYGQLGQTLYVGAGTGNSISALRKLRASRILIIEACRDSVVAIRVKYNAPLYKVINEAVGASNTVGTLWQPAFDRHYASTAKPNITKLGLAEQPIDQQTCVIRTLDTILKTYRIPSNIFNTLVIETYGVEADVLAGFTLANINRVMVTVWREICYRRCLTFHKFDRFMQQRGFDRAELVWLNDRPFGQALYVGATLT